MLIVLAAATLLSVLAISGLLAVLIRILPEGRTRSVVILLPHTLLFCRRLLTHRAVPTRARVILTFGLVYAASPVTLIPDFIPVVGKVDNVLAVVVSIRLSMAFIPDSVLIECWPGKPEHLRLLVGRRRALRVSDIAPSGQAAVSSATDTAPPA